MAKRKTKKKDGHGLLVAGALAAAGIGAYYLYGPDKEKHRKKLKGWILKASGEVLDKAERVRELDKDKYDAIVKQVTAKYKKIKDIDNKDIEKLKKDLMAQWKKIEAEAKVEGTKAAKKAKTVARKKVNKAARSVAKKTATKRTSKKK